MNAIEIIREIEQLSPAEKAKVFAFVSAPGKTRKSTPTELVDLADQMVAEEDPKAADSLESQILDGFYGK